jgi:ssDNA thymidine ADP-ribosyltransferase, DarT
VLSLLPTVLDLEGVVVTDQNAASKYVRFGAGATGLAIVDHSRTFAEYWTHSDYIEQYRRKAAKCAEVLVPHVIPPEYIRCVYVCWAQVKLAVEELRLPIPARTNSDMYFNRT